MALFFKFESGHPGTEVLRSSAETVGVSFDYSRIVTVSYNFAGYGDANEADISQTVLDTLINQIETDTGQTILGTYTKDEAITEAYGDGRR